MFNEYTVSFAYTLLQENIVIIVKTLCFGDPVNGWPSLACIIFFVSGVQLFLFGVLGQYLGKTYLEIKERPLYIIKDQKILVNKEIEINEEFKIEA